MRMTSGKSPLPLPKLQSLYTRPSVMKILIIEDEPISQKLLLHQLSPLGDCSVASTSEDAMALYRSSSERGEHFELICLDIMLPDASGQDILRQIREWEMENEVQSPAKILMTTGLNDPENVVMSFQFGCEAYITKPISRETLFSELRKLGIVNLKHPASV